MANTTISIIKALGFSQHSFAVDDAAAFDALITNELGNQVDLIKIEFPLEYKLQFVIFSNSCKFLLNSPTTPINKLLS